MNRRDKNNLVRRQRLEKEENELRLSRKIKTVFFIVLFVGIAMYAFRWSFYHFLLNNFSSQTYGVIINERNRVSSKGAIINSYTYSYKYTVNGKIYNEDSKENKYEVGEEVKVEYLEFCPSISRIRK